MDSKETEFYDVIWIELGWDWACSWVCNISYFDMSEGDVDT